MSTREKELLAALIRDGIDALQHLKECKIEDELTPCPDDVSKGFEDFLEVCGEDELEQMVLEGVLMKLEGGDTL